MYRHEGKTPEWRTGLKHEEVNKCTKEDVLLTVRSEENPEWLPIYLGHMR